ncbi:MAG: NifU family protein [Flavobacteriaceae bacterium]|nr:NifU family protein [Flavobacteriaceae bacterium]
MEDFNIDIQPTKNENIVKFIANSFITKAESFEFKNIDEAKNSPLAQQLFYLPFVKTVFISQNFIAIEKYNIVAWQDVQEEVAASIKEYIDSGKPIIISSENSKKIPVTIYAESTPNPSVLKFVANKPLTEGTFEFKNIDDTKFAPIANSLFHFPFVKEVFIHSNYISITKFDIVSWEEITLELREFLKKYLEEDKPIFTDEILQKNTVKNHAGETNSSKEVTLTEMEKEIISILNEYVQPAVAGDGGHIAFQSYNEASKTVKVVLQGACSGCPSSTFTLKNGIETMLKEMLHDQTLKVEAING